MNFANVTVRLAFRPLQRARGYPRPLNGKAVNRFSYCYKTTLSPPWTSPPSKSRQEAMHAPPSRTSQFQAYELPACSYGCR